METNENTTNKNKNKKYSASKSSNKKPFNKKSNSKIKKPGKNKSAKTKKDINMNKPVDIDPNDIYEVYPEDIVGEKSTIESNESSKETSSNSKYSRTTNPFSVDKNPKAEKFVNFLQSLITVSTLGFVIGAVCKLFGIISWPWYLITGIGYLPALIIIGIFSIFISVTYTFFFIYMILIGIPRNFIDGFTVGWRKNKKQDNN